MIVNNSIIQDPVLFIRLCVEMRTNACECDSARARARSKAVARVYGGGMSDPVTLVTAVYGIVIVLPATLPFCAR